MNTPKYVTMGNPSKVPIDPYTLDPFYRYKVIQLQIKTITNRTILPNLDNMADDLNISPNIICKYICYKMGIMGKYDKKKEYWYLQSDKISSDQLTIIIMELIDKLIMCPNCNLPELKYTRHKKKINIKCSCCSYYSDQSALDVDTKIIKLL